MMSFKKKKGTTDCTVDGAQDLAKSLQTFMTERENRILNICK